MINYETFQLKQCFDFFEIFEESEVAEPVGRCCFGLRWKNWKYRSLAAVRETLFLHLHMSCEWGSNSIEIIELIYVLRTIYAIKNFLYKYLFVYVSVRSTHSRLVWGALYSVVVQRSVVSIPVSWNLCTLMPICTLQMQFITN